MAKLRFTDTALTGVTIVDPLADTDDRGYFYRTFCREEFSAAGLMGELAQTSASFSDRRGTLRGLHFQEGKAGNAGDEAKLIRCVRGAVFDVAVDLRPDSATFGQWLGLELSAKNRRAVYIPCGFAHGVQTLEDETEVHYFISCAFDAARQRGVRWNDPTIGVAWPIAEPLLSPRDAALPALEQLAFRRSERGR